MNAPKSWKDRLLLWERHGYYGITWVVWDDKEGEIEGAVVGESRPELEDDKEFAAVHNAVEAFWRTHIARADWVCDGFWFESATAAAKALTVGNKALREARK